MGKFSRREPDDELFEDHHPGCMWGIIHALHYHHWQNTAKKMLPHKTHNGPRHTKGHGRPKAPLDAHDSNDVQKLLDAEASRFLIDPTSTGTSSTSKRWSLKARIKALISEENAKEESSKRRDSQLRRTYSIHHLEPSDNSPLGKVIRNRPIIFVHRTSKSGTRKPVSSNKKFSVDGTKNISKHLEPTGPTQLPENQTLCPEKCEKAEESSVCLWKEYVDKSLFRVNKDLSLKIQKETDDDVANCLCDLQGSSQNARLAKSGSFPSADLLRIRNFRPSKLKHKQTEVWSFPKGETLSAGTHEIEGSVNDLRNVKRTRIRRTSSMDASLERYTQLFQNSFSREAELNPSKSLKLTNEYEIPSGGQAPQSFKRVRSLSQVDFNYFLQNELSCDAQFSGIPMNTIMDSSKKIEQNSHDEQKPLELPVSTEKHVSPENSNEIGRSDSSMKKEEVASLPESMKEDSTTNVIGLGEEIDNDEQTVGENNLDEEQEIQNFSQEDLTSPADFLTSEGLECKSDAVDVQESPVEAEHRSSDISSWSCNTEKVDDIKIVNKGEKNQRHIEFCKNDNSDFDYVSVILHLSGFDGNGFLEQWHSMDQPLNPVVYEEVETCWPHETKFSGDEISARHQLLFDLTNEVLLQIYESSFTYYPRELSLGCCIRPWPRSSRFLEEVWARISRALSSSQRVGQSVEGIVTQDLGKDDGWMNLQLESECVALELEDLIFDELLEEFLYADILGAMKLPEPCR